jgi:hypothetical protein
MVNVSPFTKRSGWLHSLRALDLDLLGRLTDLELQGLPSVTGGGMDHGMIHRLSCSVTFIYNVLDQGEDAHGQAYLNGSDTM